VQKNPEFASLVEHHGKEIFIFLYRLLNESPDAEDCLQEAFLRAFQAYDRLDQGANVRAWLYRIAYNLAMTRLKQRRRRPVELPRDLPGSSPPIEHQIEQRLQLEALRAAVKTLPHKQQAALVMRKYQELGYDEIGLALDMSPEAARANVYQGLRKLRNWFSVDKAGAVGGAKMADLAGAGE
jgi:RNA polymerase sigma-70 factor (ECF subfamily)